MKKIIFTYILGIVTLASCNFLDTDAPQYILAEDYFKNETSLQVYTNGFLNSYTTSWEYLTYGDDENAEYVARTNQSNFFLDSWSPIQQGGWGTGDWSMLYNVNYYLQNMRKANASAEILNHYEGVGRFWRAWFYFIKLKSFGALPWYDKTIDAEDNEQLYKGRDSREYVVHMILQDLNYAVENCSSAAKFVNSGVINKYIAAAFKARFCLYEGTYRKYHSVDPSSQKPWSGEYESADSLLRECVKACEIVMNSNKYRIDPNLDYGDVFKKKDIQYSEVLWAREYTSESQSHGASWYYNSATSGNCWSMNKTFLNTYLNIDGTRYTDNSSYKTTPYIQETVGRDKRLEKTIITPSYKKKISGVESPYTPNFDLTRTGYQIIKWCMDDDAVETSNRSYNSLPIFRYAEVLLNYAEAKCELGEFSPEVWDATIKPLRTRAGITNTDMPSTADPYLVEYFDNTVSNKYLLEVRRERGIELYMEGLRYFDLMRWKLGHLIERPWVGIYAPKNMPQDLNTDPLNPKKICVVQTKELSFLGTDYIVLDKNPSITLNTDKCIVYEQAERVWNDKMYLRPIPQSAIDLNPNLGQNHGW